MAWRLPPGLVVSVPPAADPVSVAEAKRAMRVHDLYVDDDTLIGELIGAATELVEQMMGYHLLNATYVWSLDDFPRRSRVLRFPLPALVSVTSIEYVASGATDHAYTAWPAANNWYTDTARAAVRPFVLIDWPDVQTGDISAVKATFVAGHGASPPEQLKAAVKYLVAQLYAEPEAAPDIARVAPLLARYAIPAGAGSAQCLS